MSKTANILYLILELYCIKTRKSEALNLIEKLLKYCVLFCSWLSKQACKYSESRVFEYEKDHQCPVSDIGALLFVLQKKENCVFRSSHLGRT